MRFNFYAIVLFLSIVPIACTPTLVDKIESRANKALNIGDWTEVSYFADQMYELHDECSANNFAFLALTYYKLAELTTDIKIRQVYVNRMIISYEESMKKCANAANKKYKESQVDMNEVVRRYLQILPKYESIKSSNFDLEE